MKKKLFLASALLVGLALLGGCSEEEVAQTSEIDEDKLTIYASVFPLEDFAKKIGGDYVDVRPMMPNGGDAHTYEPTPKEMTEFAEADFILYNGMQLEGFIEPVKDALANQDVELVAVGDFVLENVPEDEYVFIEEDENEGEESSVSLDPHIWIDPMNAKDMAEVVLEQLKKAKPEAADDFTKNFEAMADDFDTLDTAFQEAIDAAPNKTIVVAHAAYGYWEKAYGLEQVAINGFSTIEEPSQQELTNIVQLIESEGIPFIIFEQNVSSRITEIIQDEVGVEDLMLHNMATVTDEDRKNGADYFSIMQQNVQTLEKALNY